MDQSELFHETFTDALRATVAALGGFKVVGSALWPEKPIEEGARLMADCLNPDRPHRLTPDQLCLVLKMARAKGIHLAMHWLAEDVGYQVTPIEPRDEMAELQREFIRAAEQVEKIAKRIERVNVRAVG